MKKLRTEQEIMQAWKGDPTQPLVSVCCITYNHEPYIEDTLEGFLIQETDFPFEILIHDDASTDKTADIIREYETAYPNLIKPIYQIENQYSKGNRPGLINTKRAKGKYIALCEGDDYWIDPHKMQKQVDFLEAKPEYGLVHSEGNFHYTENGKVVNNFFRQIGRSPNEITDPYEAILRSEYPVNTCSTMYRACLYENINFNSAPRFKMGDSLLWLELARQSKFYFFDEAMVTRHILVESAAHSKNNKKMMEFKESGYELCKYFIAKYGCTSETEAIVHEKFNRVILSYAFKVNDKEKAINAFDTLKKSTSKPLTVRDRLQKLGTDNFVLRPLAIGLIFFLRGYKKLTK
ncbi:MAG: glycosyltransferase [Desulfobacterium sp.]|nr:glycosyltransferase [Desulfobacterium sp.]